MKQFVQKLLSRKILSIRYFQKKIIKNVNSGVFQMKSAFQKLIFDSTYFLTKFISFTQRGCLTPGWCKILRFFGHGGRSQGE